MKKEIKLQLVYVEPEESVDAEPGLMYLRVSTQGQVEGESLGFQEEKCLALAKLLGITIAPEHIISEVWSAADHERPGMRKAWELVEREEVKHVLAYDTDRLERDPLYIVQFVRHCKNHGVLLHFADGTTVETVLDEALQYFKGFVGYQERQKISQRTMDGKIATAKDSRMPNGCGRGMYGYDYDPHTKKRSVNELEGPVVRDAFGWRLSGVSCCEIARRLNEKGIPAKQGGKWTASSVRTMLRNEAYTGFQWWGKHRYEMAYGKERGRKRKVTLKPEEEWVRIKGFSPMIIEPALFQAVQEAMDSNPRRGKLWNYVFTSFFFCGGCNSKLSGATQAEGHHRNGTYPYYRCRGTLVDVSSAKARPKICSVRPVRADQLEPVVLEHILAAVRNPRGIIEDLREGAANGGAKLQRRISGLEKQEKKHRGELATLTWQRMKENIDQEMFESLAAQVNNVLAQLAKDIAVLEEQKKIGEEWDLVEERLRIALAMYADSLGGLDDEGMQRLMRLLNIRLTREPERVLVTGILDPSLFTTEQTLA